MDSVISNDYYNIAGGRGTGDEKNSLMYGKKHSKEIKLKMSKVLLGRKLIKFSKLKIYCC